MVVVEAEGRSKGKIGTVTSKGKIKIPPISRTFCIIKGKNREHIGAFSENLLKVVKSDENFNKKEGY